MLSYCSTFGGKPIFCCTDGTENQVVHSCYHGSEGECGSLLCQILCFSHSGVGKSEKQKAEAVMDQTCKKRSLVCYYAPMEQRKFSCFFSFFYFLSSLFFYYYPFFSFSSSFFITFYFLPLPCPLIFLSFFLSSL